MRQATRRAVLANGAGALAATLAGCGTQQGSTATPTPSETPGARGTVGMDCEVEDDEGSFLPPFQWIETGASVTWSVESTCGQQTVAYHPDNDAPLRIPEAAEAWASPYMHGSGTYERTFEVPGVYNYHGVFEDFGQVGIVVVGRPDAADQPGLAPPQESIPERARTNLESLIGEAERVLE